MQHETESEYKFLASKKQFQNTWERFSKEYPICNYKVHVNYYYDTNDNMLDKKNVTVRIRQECSNLKWQLKEHKEARNSLFLCDEYSGNLDDLPSIIKIDDIDKFLYLKGTLITERKALCFGNGSKICFDVSMYLGIVDYEIEIEYNPVDKESVIAIVNAVGLKDTLVMTKSRRFFKRLEEIENGKSITSLC